MRYVGLTTLLVVTMVGQPTPPNPNPRLYWVPVTTNEDGTPCTDLAGYVVASFVGGTPHAEKETATDGHQGTPVLDLVKGVPAGNVVEFRVLAFDTSGNSSVWSEPLQWRVPDYVAPGKPGGLRCE